MHLNSELLSVEQWRKRIQEDPVYARLLDNIESGATDPRQTLRWDFNWINIALALNRTRALELILQAHGIDSTNNSMTLKEQIAMILLLQDEGGGES